MLWSRTLALVPLLALAAGAPAVEPTLDFNRDIRPILSNTCFKCHGFDEPQRQAALRLDTREGATAELPSGARAIVPGRSGESALLERITASDPELRMPPPSSGKFLTEDQIARLRQWIDEGARYEAHWSFVAPVRHAPPPIEGAATPIDAFIQDGLAAQGLKPSPEADKQTLIRRVTFDLTGLPPTPAEIDAFLADGSPEAYEKVVDRLLASPRYGEHMARYWLDAARYGDTHGLHFDNERSLWPYREWVIGAFNRNLPFSEFTVEQLAGDLLPNATREQRVATGFNRCNVTTNEGGSIDEEVLVRYAVDRVETTSTVWLGLTLGCAVCHNHKFDPVSQREFYQLFAFFNNVADKAMDGNILAPPPILKLPTPEQDAEAQNLRAGLAELEAKAAAELAAIDYDEPPGGTLLPSGPREYVWLDDELPPGAKPTEGDQAWSFVGALDRPVFSGSKAAFRSSEGLSQHYFTEARPPLRIGEGDRFFVYVYLDPARPPRSIMLQFNDGDWEHRAFWGEDLIPYGTSGTPSRLSLGGLPDTGQWVRLEVEAAKVGLQAGDRVNGVAFTQHGGTVLWDRLGLLTRAPQGDERFESQAAWEAYARATPSEELPQPVREAVGVEPALRTPEQQALVRAHFLRHEFAGTRERFAPFEKEIVELDKRLKKLDAEVAVTMVMAEGDGQRKTHLLERGAYDKPGEEVQPGVPAVIAPPLPSDAPPNRLSLARWLVDPANPLPARVTVNRLWQQLFGVGLVKTAEDFGSQGEWPSHPELLDWLATEFVGSGWDVKRLMRLLVTSDAYRQSSRVTPETFERDPENRFLARGPRYRLDAEIVRDAALDLSGLLIERIGGPSVKPYQPEGLWEAVGFVGSNTEKFQRDAGEALYRRSMYTFWKRTSPPPSMSAFDAPSRETCTVRRARTNTPLQALVLMNDEQYVEAARRLAERVIREGGVSTTDRARHLFRAATSRKPTADETATLVAAYEAHLADFQADRTAADKLLGVGEAPRDAALDSAALAAWTMVANLVLNLDETVTKS